MSKTKRPILIFCDQHGGITHVANLPKGTTAALVEYRDWIAGGPGVHRDPTGAHYQLSVFGGPGALDPETIERAVDRHYEERLTEDELVRARRRGGAR